MRRHLVIPVAAFVLAIAASPANAFVDKDCSDFNSWHEAQRYYKKHGGRGTTRATSTATMTASPARTCNEVRVTTEYSEERGAYYNVHLVRRRC